jgi:hypothetical protein
MKLVKILAVAAMLVAGAAQAGGYATFEYSNETKRVDDTESIKGALVAGYKTADNMDYSIKMESSQTELGSGSIGTGVELRAKKTFAAVSSFDIKPYLGVRLGEKISSSTHFSHYAVDTGIKFPIIGDLSGDVGVRYRNAFDTVNALQSTRYHGILAYALTKQDSVAIRYSQAYGDSGEEKNAWRLSYTRSF